MLFNPGVHLLEGLANRLTTFRQAVEEAGTRSKAMGHGNRRCICQRLLEGRCIDSIALACTLSRKIGTLAVVAAAAMNLGLMSARKRDCRPLDQRCCKAVNRPATRLALSALFSSQASFLSPETHSPARLLPTASNSMSKVPR